MLKSIISVLAAATDLGCSSSPHMFLSYFPFSIRLLNHTNRRLRPEGRCIYSAGRKILCVRSQKNHMQCLSILHWMYQTCS